VSISFGNKEGTIEFIVRDNGVGFDLNEALSLKSFERGLGLVGMKERIMLSGGTVNIESTVGAGTTIRASWPLS
jgi:signal transduction histidine kinase